MLHPYLWVEIHRPHEAVLKSNSSSSLISQLKSGRLSHTSKVITAVLRFQNSSIYYSVPLYYNIVLSYSLVHFFPARPFVLKRLLMYYGRPTRLELALGYNSCVDI